MPTITANYDFGLTVSEELVLGLDQTGDPTITHSISGGRTLVSDGTAPAVTLVWSDDITLSSGHTIDLRALTDRKGPDGVAVNKDFDGLKIQLVKIVALAANDADLVFKKGGTNGYNLFGGTTWFAVPPGGSYLAYFNDKLADVSATVKTIDITGTDGDKFKIILVAG